MATKKTAGRPEKAPEDTASIQIALRLLPAELKRIDAYRTTQRFTPTRTDVVKLAVAEFLDREEKK